MHKKIMIVIDGSDVTDVTVREGLQVARTYRANVLFYFVLPNYTMPITDAPIPLEWSPQKLFEEAKRKADKTLAAASAHAKEHMVRSAEALGSGPDTAECIANAAESRKCDLIVIGSHGRTALQRLLLGSVVTRLITLSTMPVLVCKKMKPPRVPRGAVAPMPIKRRKLRQVAAHA